MNLSAQELCSAIRGQFVQRGDHAYWTGVSIDSREKSLKGKVFFALRGPRFDGHDFLTKAVQKGAEGLVIDQAFSDGPALFASKDSQPTVIKVKDTLKALKALASYWRRKHTFQVIGITGSSGKTTTKLFCQILIEKAFSVQASPKSFNNHYGVPLSLLSANENTDILIQEIGMNQKGEVASLTRLARPDTVVVTEVASSHIGLLGGKDNIAKEKEQIYRTCPSALPVFNGDNAWTKLMYERWKKRRFAGQKAFVFSSQDKKADIFLKVKKAKKDHLWLSGHIQGVKGNVLVPVTGSVHLNNIMCSVALALATGLTEKTIWDRLPLCHLPPGRNQWIKLACGAEVLFDGYNASPESVMALLRHFLSPVVHGKKVLILGDFLELGDFLAGFQKTVAEFLAKNPVQVVWIIGDQAPSLATALKQAGYSAVIYSNNCFDLKRARHIKSFLNAEYVMAFKGSRKSQLEKVLKCFEPLSLPTF